MNGTHGTPQGDATKCRCGRTEFFPKDCPCQKLPRRDGRTGTPPSKGLPPLDIAGILWVAAIDRVPIGGRIEWVKAMEQRVAEINAHRAMIDTERPPESVFEEFREIHGV